MPSAGVGEDIEDLCSRCGDTWHVVMARIGDRIAKVVCKRCGSQHNYRGENTAPAAVPNAGGNSSAFARRFNKRRPRRGSGTAPTPTPAFDPNQPPRSYNAREGYQPGERVVHPTFGTGVVATAPGPGKVEVVFPAGPRTLACAKAESTLARPVNISDAPIGDRPPDKG